MISKNKSVIWTWPKQKFLSLFQQVKIQVRKSAGSRFHGNISGVHHFSTHSQLIDIKGAGTQKYNGQGVYWTGPTPQRRCPGERCWLLTAAGLFDEGPADTGTMLTYRFPFLFAIYFPFPISSLRKKQSPFLLSSIVCDLRVVLRLWTSPSNRAVDRYYLLSPSLWGTQNHAVRGRRCQERYVYKNHWF